MLSRTALREKRASFLQSAKFFFLALPVCFLGFTASRPSVFLLLLQTKRWPPTSGWSRPLFCACEKTHIYRWVHAIDQSFQLHRYYFIRSPHAVTDILTTPSSPFPFESAACISRLCSLLFRHLSPFLRISIYLHITAPPCVSSSTNVL